MKTIHKYEIPITHFVKLPAGAEILTVHAQGERLYLWALIDTSADFTFRRIYSIGTGHLLQNEISGDKYLGTVYPTTGFVYHIFEGLPE